MSPGEMIRELEKSRDKITDRDDLNFLDDMVIKTSNGGEVRGLAPYQLIWVKEIHSKL